MIGGFEPGRAGRDSAGSDGAGSLAQACAEIVDSARLQAVTRTGLTAESDPRMEEFAQWVRDSMNVPVALVSLVRETSQVFPGMTGLTGLWAQERATPLTHSFCQYVVRDAQPLIVTDVGRDPSVRDLAVADLGVVAYAGMPLTDQDGLVLGSLCAIDRVPRAWTDAQLRTLRRIAEACSTDLRLRLARFAEGAEDLRRDVVDLAARRAYERSQTLLLASQQFSATTTVQDVVARIQGLVTSSLRPTVISMILVGPDGRLRRQEDLDTAATLNGFGIDTSVPTATAIREARLVHYPDRPAYDAANPPEASDLLRRLGLHTVVAVPLPGPDGPIGAIGLGWPNPAAVDATDLLTIASIAGYAAQALQRADVLRDRITVAHELQNAMLTALPTITGLDMAARYAPADSREHVGGDWYDAAPLPDTPRVGARAVAVSVGDIIGHTLEAATIMGQTRSMLRQAAWDNPGDPPTAVLRAFETANLGLQLDAAGTAVMAHLHQLPDRTWSMTWTNAGHPPPILIAPDGTTELLDQHDALFGFAALSTLARTDHIRDIPDGATVFLYTDGLIEHRAGRDIDTGIDDLLHLLHTIHAQPLQDIVDTAVDTLARDAPDDVIAFAIRFNRSPNSSPERNP